MKSIKFIAPLLLLAALTGTSFARHLPECAPPCASVNNSQTPGAHEPGNSRIDSPAFNPRHSAPDGELR